MNYLELYEYLKNNVTYEPDVLRLEQGLTLKNYEFVSKTSLTSPNTPSAFDGEPGINPALAEEMVAFDETPDVLTLFGTDDDDIEENRRFLYHVLGPEDPAEGAIILLHGFNERHWDKYLPMAVRLYELTGRAVVLFPIAFHMNRSPSTWHDARTMQKVSRYRKKLFPDIICSTLSNAAISVRLHADPARFFWSGHQSYEDLVTVAGQIRAGTHPAFKTGASINFFTYSIGTLLGEIIMMTNPEGLFSESKFVTFCGGPVFNRLSPVSKFILDSEANVRLYSFLVEHLDSHRRHDQKLDQLLGQTEVGLNFRALLNYRLDLNYREDKFRSLAPRILAVALAQDEVVPPFEVINTLQGSRRNLGVKVEVIDFPYPYRHEDPFPASAKHEDSVNYWFNRLFAGFSDFLK
ncbi:MAG: DUF6051 family protein [Deltaproteobacteria bacterium]|jgi:hypothetical protein|nr:DUF6051 family protein [Deltaproteobacteria bacterium]